MTEYLLNIATKGNKDYGDEEVRGRVGYISGIVGLVINLILSISKLIIGLAISSIAVMADAFNNLSDAASSIMTIVGFKLSNSPPDEKHPYGHGRVEYITAFIISFMVIMVGFQFIKSSLDRIINPKAVIFQWIPFTFLILSMISKVWLSIFNRKLSEKIDSSALKAVSIDSLWDVVTTFIVASSLLSSFVTDYPIDGYIGIFVSALILYSGFSLIKENISQLIGEAPEEDLVNCITEGVLSYDYVLGVHDLIVHNYGPKKIIATIDVEVPYDIDIVTIHNIVDKAEDEIGEKYNLYLVIHIDPIKKISKDMAKNINSIKDELRKDNVIKCIKDFKFMVEDSEKYINCDLILDYEKLDKDFSKSKFKEELIARIKSIDSSIGYNITIDI
ncbi:cation diffusion facilitator family transporter [Wansuia hejianensis]|uniref:Cation transporter n=1 Tax=Wansuia hejianensis TaxID=2763667 RepID=A0A926F1K5_9FIRM|nr:cation diffusion facilitator family transporter [Wansuia hejianensis]MBC8590269.1 cation transporter [Wansuia hejianensis]